MASNDSVRIEFESTGTVGLDRWARELPALLIVGCPEPHTQDAQADLAHQTKAIRTSCMSSWFVPALWNLPQPVVQVLLNPLYLGLRQQVSVGNDVTRSL